MVPLPPYARRIEYLGSTGTQYIDTGIAPDSGSIRISARIYVLAGTGVYAVFGSRSDIAVDSYNLFGYQNYSSKPHTLRFDFGNDQTPSNVQNCTDTGIYEGWYDVGVDGRTMTVSKGSSTYTVVAKKSSASNQYPMYLFSVNTAGTPWSTDVADGIRCSSFVVWRNGTLVRSFIPCRILNTGYMWDEVEGRLYGNSGTGEFYLGFDCSISAQPTQMSPMGVGRVTSDALYTENGAIMIMDGSFNSGSGTHSSIASVWSDLAENRPVTLTRASDGWDENSLNTKKTTGGDASTVAAGTFPGIRFAENTTVEMVFKVDSAQNANGEVIMFCGGYDRFAFSFVSGGTAGSRIIMSTPDTRIDVDTTAQGADPDLCDLNKIHSFCAVFGSSNSLTGWALYHNGRQQPLVIKGGNLGTQTDGIGSICGRTTISNSPDNADGKIYAIRVYNRALSQAEAENHWLIDSGRFKEGQLRLWNDGSPNFEITTAWPLVAGAPVTGQVEGNARSGLLDSNLMTVLDTGGSYIGELADTTPGGVSIRWFDMALGQPLPGYCEIG